MSDIIDTVQLQETEDALVTLFEITLPSGTVAYFFDGLDDGTNNIYFPEKTITGSSYALQEYVAIPIEVSGIETASSGAANRPTLRIANIPIISRSVVNNEDGTNDENTIRNILLAEGINTAEDLLNSKVVVRSTLLSKTYTSSDSNPTSPAAEFPSQTYIIDRVSGESNLIVEFELASPMDIEGVTLPSRVVVGRYCPWRYQGHYIPDSDGNPSNDGGCIWPTDSKGRFFDEKDNVITKDITTIPTYDSTAQNTQRAIGYKTKTITNGHTEIWSAIRVIPAETSDGQFNPRTARAYWKRLDVCGKTLTSCKIRFQGNNTNDNLNTRITLPFGGFPGSKQFR